MFMLRYVLPLLLSNITATDQTEWLITQLTRAGFWGSYRRTKLPMNRWSNTDICRSKVELQQQTFHFVPNPSNAFNSLRIVCTLPFQLSWAEGNQAAISLGHNKHLVSLAEQIKRRFGWGNKTVLFCFLLTVWNVKILRRISSPFFPLPDRAWNHSVVFPPLHNNLPL